MKILQRVSFVLFFISSVIYATPEIENSYSYEELNKLTASDADASDSFGNSVSISGEYAIVGAYGDDDNGSDSGSAYIFKKDDNNNFTQISKLTASDANASDSFGNSVSISGEYAIVGAYGDDDNGSLSGSAYIFKKDDNNNFIQISKLTASDANTSDYFGTSVSISGEYAIVGASANDDNGSDSGSAYIFNSIIKTSIPENSIIAIDINSSNASNYSISGGADQNLFDINSTTGIVTFKIAPDFENPHDSNRDNLYKISITVSDGSNGVSKNIEISVTNQILELDSISNVNKIEDANGFSIELNATDSNSDTITYTAISSDISIATVLITNDTNLTVTPIANANGLVRIDVNATANGKSVMQSFNLNVRAINDMPTINPIENITKNENFDDFNVSLIGISDVEMNDLNISFETNDSTIITLSKNWTNNINYTNYDGKEFKLTISSISDQNGITEVTITIDDGTIIITEDFNITVIASDKTPNDFSFTTKTNQALSTLVESNMVTITGIANGIDISIVDGEYKINSGSWTSDTGTINNEDNITLRLSSSSSYSKSTTASLTVGSVTKSFNVITKSAPEPETPTESETALQKVADIIADNTKTITAQELNNIDGVSGAVTGVDYSEAIANGTYVDSDNPTSEEINTVIHGVNSASVAPVDNTNPIISTLTPSTDESNVSVISDLVIIFNENVVAGSGTMFIKKISNDSIVDTISSSSELVTISGSVVTINPDKILDFKASSPSPKK